MILDVLCVRNKVMGAYANPYFTQEKLENLEENFSRSLLTSEQVRQKYAHCAIYHLGTFDDKSGKFIIHDEPTLLLDCDDVIASLPKGE